MEHNLHTPPQDRILVFSVKEITEGLPIDLIQNATAFQPLYVKKFIQYLSEAILHLQNDLQIYFAHITR